jgi:hypothetical protein
MGWILGITLSGIILLLTNRTIANLKSERDFYKGRCVWLVGGKPFNQRMRAQIMLENQYRDGDDPNPDKH